MQPEQIGRYEIKAELGRGGMATVHLAHDPHIRRDVAVKVLPRQFLHDPTFRTRFAREAQIIASLEHPAIVPIYDYGEHDGQPYLVMRYMPGGTLAEHMAQKGALSIPTVVEIIKRIAGALERAHKQGIIHRDLKPANVLFDQFGEAYLADFGIVKVAAEGSSALTGSGVIGTPAYMSPELARGERLDGRSDVYALGAMVFEMLTGQKPYQADTPMGLAVKHITEPVPSIRAVKKDLPAGTETIIQRSMAKERVHRYPTPTDLIHDLQNLHTHPAHQPPQTASAVPQPARRIASPLLIGCLALLCLASLITTGLILQNNLATPLDQEGASPPPAIVSTLPPEAAEETIDSGLDIAPTVTMPSTLPTGARITPDNASALSEIARLGNGSVQTVAFSPDGTQFLVAGGLGVWLYDTATMTELAWLDGHPRTVRGAAWSPDGTQIASGSDDGLLVVWEVTTGRVTQQWQAHTSWIRTLTWSPDSTQLASSSDDRTAKIWSLTSDTPLVTFEAHTHWVRVVAWSPDGQWLASGDSDGNLFVWDTAGSISQSWAQTTPVNHLAWSPDSTQLVTAGGSGQVRLWALDEAEPLQEAVRHSGEVWQVAWHPAGAQIASSSQDGTITLLNATTLATTQVLDEFVGGIPALSWHENSLLTASEAGLVQHWDSDTGSLRGRLTTHSAPINVVAWSPDSTQLALGTEALGVEIWDSETGQKVADLVGHTAGLRGVAWSPDGTRLVSGDFVGLVRVWDVASGRELTVFRHGNVVEGVAWSPDGQWVASSGRGEGVRVWDIATSQNLFNLPHNGATIEQVAWSSDGHWLATAASDNQAYIWNGQTGEPTTTLPHTTDVTALAWSPGDTNLAVGTNTGIIQLWVSGTWQEAATLSDHVGAVRSLAWSPDGDMLVSVGWDRVGRVWDIPAGNLLTTLSGHRFTIWSVAWSPDGRYIATASGDGSTRLFGISE